MSDKTDIKEELPDENPYIKKFNGMSNAVETEQTADLNLYHPDDKLKEDVGQTEISDKLACAEEKTMLQASVTVEIDDDIPLTELRYGLLSKPPFLVILMAALQHILLSISSCLAQSQVVADTACAPFDHPVRSQLFCTTLFMVGVCTLFQTAFGIRLSVFQGSSSSFLVPLIAVQSQPLWACDHLQSKNGAGVFSKLAGTHTMDNNTLRDMSSTPQTELDPMPDILWRLQMMSGSLMVGALLEVTLGGLGLLKFIVRAIGPITVACTVSLIGVSLGKLPVMYGRPSYSITIGCSVLVAVFILYCKDITVPLPRIGKGSKNKPRSRFPIFQLIPILLALLVMWAVTWILTLANVFTDDKDDISYLARADAKLPVIGRSHWLQVTYPGQFGTPKFDAPLLSGYLVAFFTSTIESVGDYYAAQKVCQMAHPPDHAVCRGILMEGLGSVLSGAVGAGHATTSYSANIALLSVSKTASRYVMYLASALLVGVSMFGKAGAALTTVPNPVLGGILVVLISTIFSIGMENLTHVDMRSSRNMVVMGLPFMCGIMIPACLEKYPELINTGSPSLDQVLKVMLGMPMFIGGALSLILDNTVPGSLESRGMSDHRRRREKETEPSNQTKSDSDLSVYSWTCYPRLVKAVPWIAKLPFMPKA